MPRYAANTKVSPEKSQEDIKRVLRRYGCEGFGTMEGRGRAAVAFEYQSLSVRIEVPLPSPDDREFRFTANDRRRNDAQAREAHEQAIRQRWRALLQAIRAKLEAVECGISTLEEEFMPWVVTSNGQTVGQRLMPRLHEICDPQSNVQLLPAPERG